VGWGGPADSALPWRGVRQRWGHGGRHPPRLSSALGGGGGQRGEGAAQAPGRGGSLLPEGVFGAQSRDNTALGSPTGVFIRGEKLRDPSAMPGGERSTDKSQLLYF